MWNDPIPAFVAGRGLGRDEEAALAIVEDVSPSNSGTPPAVVIPGTERHLLRSELTGRLYDVSIALPEGNPDTVDGYPVIYVLDGQWHFKLVMSIYGALRYDEFISDAIVVGIAAGGDDPDHEALRIRDYLPTPHPDGDSGDAERFLAFVTSELMPFVARNYRIDPDDRTLIGSSLGGLFALYAMLTQPDLFHRIVAASPAIAWDEEAVTAWEDRFARDHSDLSVRLYLSAGELEPSHVFLDPLDRFSARLHSRGYEGLGLRHSVIPGERHSSTIAEAFNRGLRWVFAKPTVALSAAALQSYAGEYSLDDGQSLPSGPAVQHLSQVSIRVEGDHLVLDDETGIHKGEELVPTRTDEFTFTGSIPGVARFLRDAQGSVERLAIDASAFLLDRTLTLDRVR